MKKMKHLRIFELFKNYQDYPDIFGKSLLRGVKIDKDEYIDDPKLRNVSTGQSMSEDYVSFIKNYKNIGLQDPTKSIHFYLNPTRDQIEGLGWYGNAYRPIPIKDAKFSFSKETRNGGLGSTWWFIERTLDYFLNMSDEDISNFLELHTIYREDKSEFYRKASQYQNLLVEGGVVGNLTYDELLELSKKGNQNLQIWTESPVLHKKIEKDIKDPKPYKNKPLLNKTDFEDLDIDFDKIKDFYKSEGDKLKSLQDLGIPFDMKREEALEILKSWKMKL
jgi:hypothetical protein